MEFVISFDMRAPAFGAPIRDLYEAAPQFRADFVEKRGHGFPRPSRRPFGA